MKNRKAGSIRKARARMNRIKPGIERKLSQPEEPKPEHDVRVDRAGSRYTCYTDSCNQTTLIRQPHMNDEEWAWAKGMFFAKHPNPKNN